MEQIIVTVSDSGEVKVEAKCVTGQGCAALTKAIENALGSTAADVKKPEFYQQQAQVAKQGVA